MFKNLIEKKALNLEKELGQLKEIIETKKRIEVNLKENNVREIELEQEIDKLKKNLKKTETQERAPE